MSNTTTIIAIATLTACTIYTLVTTATARDNELDMFAQCITAHATIDHFPAPYSRDAWETYAPTCTK